MKLQLFILYYSLKSIYGFNIPAESIVGSVRIIGGKDARDGEAPFQCLLVVNETSFCGCSIISERYVLTAGHCVLSQTAENLLVLMGTNDLTRGGTFHEVANYSVHENYDIPKFTHDIAVVELQEKVQFNEKVQPIELGVKEVPDDADVELFGWGKLSANGTIPMWLQVIKLKTISMEKCRGIYGKGIHDSLLCTLTRSGEGACHGDSGGAILWNQKIIGIVKAVVPCGIGLPDIHTKISYLSDWIVQHMV